MHDWALGNEKFQELSIKKTVRRLFFENFRFLDRERIRAKIRTDNK